jgi:hypothetical protein
LYAILIEGFGIVLATFAVDIVGPDRQSCHTYGWTQTNHFPGIGILVVDDGILEWPEEILLESEM